MVFSLVNVGPVRIRLAHSCMLANVVILVHRYHYRCSYLHCEGTVILILKTTAIMGAGHTLFYWVMVQ